jgi:tetratricopeptide (TPR) repeat protein
MTKSLKIRIAVVALLAMFCAAAAPRVASAQWALQSGEMDQQIRHGIELVYDMDFSAADRTFDSVIAAHPEHPSGYFYRAMVFFWRAITNPDNTTYDKSYREWLDKSLTRADALLAKNEKDVTGIFYKGAALGMRARIFAIRPSWTDAIDLILGDAKKGLKYLNEIEEIIPSNPDVLFGRGLFNYYVEATKEDHPFLAPVIGIFATGNKPIGLQMLEIAAHDALYARTEAQYELVKLYYSYEKNYARSYAYSQYLVNKYPNNVIFLHYLGFNQVTENMPEKYDSTYRVILERCRQKKEAYTIRQAREAMHFLGQAALLLPNRNIDSALYFLYNADLLSRQITPKEIQWWTVREELMMGEAYDVKGDRTRAMDMYRRVLDMPDFNGAHADAERYMKSPYRKNG